MEIKAFDDSGLTGSGTDISSITIDKLDAMAELMRKRPVSPYYHHYCSNRLRNRMFYLNYLGRLKKKSPRTRLRQLYKALKRNKYKYAENWEEWRNPEHLGYLQTLDVNRDGVFLDGIVFYASQGISENDYILKVDPEDLKPLAPIRSLDNE